MTIEVTKNGYVLADDGYVSSDDERDFYDDGGFTAAEIKIGLNADQQKKQNRYKRYLENPKLEKKRIKAKRVWHRMAGLLAHLNTYKDKKAVEILLGSIPKLDIVHPNSYYDQLIAGKRNTSDDMNDIDWDTPYIIQVGKLFMGVGSRSSVRDIADLCVKYNRKCQLVCLANRPMPVVLANGGGNICSASYLLGVKDAEYLDDARQTIVVKGEYASDYNDLIAKTAKFEDCKGMKPVSLVKCPDDDGYVLLPISGLEYFKPYGADKCELTKFISENRPHLDMELDQYWRKAKIGGVYPCQDLLRECLGELGYTIEDEAIEFVLTDSALQTWIREHKDDCSDVESDMCLKIIEDHFHVRPSTQQLDSCLQACGYTVRDYCIRPAEPRGFLIVTKMPSITSPIPADNIIVGEYLVTCNLDGSVEVTDAVSDEIAKFFLSFELDGKHAMQTAEWILEDGKYQMSNVTVFKIELRDINHFKLIEIALRGRFPSVETPKHGLVFVGCGKKFITTVKEMVNST